MKALNISLDKELFQAGDACKRMISYGSMTEQTDILVPTTVRREARPLSDRVDLWATNSSNKFFSFFDLLKLGRKIIKKNQTDLIIAQDPFFLGLAGLFLAKRFKLKLLVGVFGTNVFDAYWLKESWNHRLLKMIGLFVFKRADAIQTDGTETFEELRKNYGQKVFWKPIIPTDIDKYRLIEKKSDSSVFKILFVGRMVEQKNLPLLVKIIKKVLNQNYNKKISFTIIGDGPLRSDLMKSLTEESAKGSVVFVKQSSREEIVDYYRQSQVLILTSFYEGFAKVFMEAAAIGLPIVATRVSGVINVIKNGVSGFIVEQADAEGFIEALSRLISNQNLWLNFSENIKRDFWQNYSFETTLKKQKDIYDYLFKLN
jgi:glycosyltransferase involved in cell wall biosynthesis